MSGHGRKDTLSSDDMKLLFQLQVWNRELRSELGLAEEEVPQVDLQTEEFVEQLRQAALEGYLLSEELQSLEKELSSTAMNLTEAQLAILDREMDKHEPEPIPDDLERCCADIMEDVQKVTRQNIELSSSYDERIRNLEVELQNVADHQCKQGIVPSWMLRQLEALESDCDTLELRWRQVQKHQRDEEQQLIQRLRAETEIQLQELGRLREVIKDSKQKPPAPSLEPLEKEAIELRREIDELLWRKRSEQAKAEQQSQTLRAEIRALEDRLQQTMSQKSVMEEVLEGLKNSHSATANSSRELRELQRDQEFLEKECIRTERRIIILDEKIESLSKEAEDLRQRAAVVMSALPDAPADHEVSYLHMQRQRQVQELRREQSQLQREQEAAEQELEAAKVEASVLEHKIRSLGGVPPMLPGNASEAGGHDSRQSAG